MNNLYSLLLTLLVGVFFLGGFLLVFVVKRKEELIKFSTGMAFVVMLGMVFMDLIPEIIEMSETLTYGKIEKLVFLGFFILSGVFLLKVFDKFLPHHHHDHHEKEDEKEHNDHLYHIGFITTFSLILHNILEGMSIYIIGLESLSTAFITAIAVGCHNLPLGIEIAGSMFKMKDHSKLKYIMMFLLIVSSSFGAIGLFFFGKGLPVIVLLALVCLACGMILYIALFELLSEVFNYRKDKLVYLGMLTGILIIGLMTFLE